VCFRVFKGIGVYIYFLTQKAYVVVFERVKNWAKMNVWKAKRKKPVWGVVVKQKTKWKKAHGFEPLVDYNIHLEKNIPGTKGFFTHGTLHKAIEKFPEKIGDDKISKTMLEEKQGYISMSADHDKKAFYVSHFYPTSLADFLRQGIATFVRKEVVKALLRDKRFKSYTIQSRKNPSPQVELHLEKRGIDPKKAYTLKEYLKILESYKPTLQ